MLDQWKMERLDKLCLVSLADALVYINVTFSHDQNPSYPLAVVHHSFSHYKSQHPFLSKIPTFRSHLRIAHWKCSQGRIPCTQLFHACILSIRHLFSQRRYHLLQSSSYVRKLQMRSFLLIISSVLRYVASRQTTFSDIPRTRPRSRIGFTRVVIGFTHSLFKIRIQNSLTHSLTLKTHIYRTQSLTQLFKNTNTELTHSLNFSKTHIQNSLTHLLFKKHIYRRCTLTFQNTYTELTHSLNFLKHE